MYLSLFYYIILKQFWRMLQFNWKSSKTTSAQKKSNEIHASKNSVYQYIQYKIGQND